MGSQIKSEIIKDLDIPIPNYPTIFLRFSYRPMLKKPTGFIESTRGVHILVDFIVLMERIKVN